MDFTPEQLYTAPMSQLPITASLEPWLLRAGNPEKAIALITLGRLTEGSCLPTVTQLVAELG